MDKRDIRIGDWVCDASNYNFVLRVGINEIRFAHIFTAVGLSERFLGNFKKESIGENTIYYREDEGRGICSLQKEGLGWRITIHTSRFKVEGIIHSVHELQHFLSDCGLYFDICDCGERP